VSTERAIAGVLDHLSDAQVETLARACDGRSAPGATLGHTVAGVTPAGHDAVAQLALAWSRTHGLTGAGVALALRTALAARRSAAACRSRPVWTGPGASGAQRLTGTVLSDLVNSATERVLLVSFAAFTLTRLANDLAAAVARECTVDVVFETEDDSAGGYSGPHIAPFASVAGITRWRWPAERRQEGALLHAKLLVVDGRRALVGSANLTHRALTANLEAGVLIEDAAVAAQLDRHVGQLMVDGTLARR
jgi:cardiolipin synthase C